MRYLSRRRFCTLAASAAACAPRAFAQTGENVHFNVADYDRTRILAAANDALARKPQPPSSIPTPIAGIPQQAYYSQSTEWFKNDDGTGYEHRRGLIDPAAFTAHRDALVALGGCVAACVAAWRLTSDAKYATHAMSHLHAWFLAPDTAMAPNLEHAGSITGKAEGSPAGVEETVALAEVIRAASFLCAYNGVATEEESAGLRKWCNDFATWMNDSKKGMIARESKDRLTICWTLQVAEAARFAKMGALQLDCSHRFRDKLIRLMNLDGQFDTELHRPDSYLSSLFTLDCLALTCEVISSPLDRLWEYTLPDGRGMRSAASFLYPAIENRGAWKYPADPQHFSDWPVRQPSLLFAGRAFTRPEYIATWKRLPAEPKSVEMLRYFPVRQPALWTVRAPA
jgi:hypothetical protein